MNQLHASGIGVMDEPQQTMLIRECAQLCLGEPLVVERFFFWEGAAKVIALDQVVFDEQGRIGRALYSLVRESVSVEAI